MGRLPMALLHSSSSLVRARRSDAMFWQHRAPALQAHDRLACMVVVSLLAAALMYNMHLLAAHAELEASATDHHGALVLLYMAVHIALEVAIWAAAMAQLTCHVDHRTITVMLARLPSLLLMCHYIPLTWGTSVPVELSTGKTTALSYRLIGAGRRSCSRSYGSISSSLPPPPHTHTHQQHPAASPLVALLHCSTPCRMCHSGCVSPQLLNPTQAVGLIDFCWQPGMYVCVPHMPDPNSCTSSSTACCVCCPALYCTARLVMCCLQVRWRWCVCWRFLGGRCRSPLQSPTTQPAAPCA